MSDTEPHQRLAELIDRLHHGSLDPEGQGELESLLLADEDAREFFVRSQELHTMLETDRTVRLQLASNLLPDNVIAMPGAPPPRAQSAPVRSSPFRVGSPGGDPGLNSSRTGSRYRFGTSVVAMFAALFVIIWMMLETTPQAPDGPDDGSGPNLAATERERGVSFHDEILPILSENCFACHGPEADPPKAGLRLDLAGAPSEDGGAVIVAGNPTASEVIARISSRDPDYRMPPAEDGRERLGPDEISLISRWIAEGALRERKPPTEQSAQSLLIRLSDD